MKSSVLKFDQPDFSIQSTVEKILDWNFSEIKSYMLDKYVYNNQETISAMHLEYARYLAICINYKESFPIAQKIDPFWHTHILHTKDYSIFCDHVAGRFLHHLPALGNNLQSLEIPFKKIWNLYSDNFGDPDPVIWNYQCCKECTCHAGGCASCTS